MSLINDALRKARQEAAEHEAEERGVQYRPPRAHLPQQSKLGLGVVLGLVFGFLAAFAGAYLLLRPTAPPATIAVTSAAPASVTGDRGPAVAPLESAAAPVEESAPTPAAPEVEPEVVAASSPATAPAAAIEPSSRVPGAEASVSPGVAPASSSPARVAAAAQDPGGSTVGGEERLAAPDGDDQDPVESLPRIQPPDRVGQIDDSNEFVLEADLGDIKLTLDFIVWIPGRAFAQINGSQVEEGELVEELLVEKIERERVTLRGANGRLVLRVR